MRDSVSPDEGSYETANFIGGEALEEEIVNGDIQHYWIGFVHERSEVVPG